MHFSLIPIKSASTVFVTYKNKIGYVFQNFNLKFHGYNDASSFLSLLLFHVSRALEGDPKKLFSLFRRGHNHKLTFSRHFQHDMSTISNKKNVDESILANQISINPRLSKKLFGYEVNQFDQSQLDSISPDYKLQLISCIKKTVVIPANHYGLNSCFNYTYVTSDGLEKLYSFRVGHNLTWSKNPTNLVTSECIPVIPLGINKGHIQYVTQDMSLFPPIPTSCFIRHKHVIEKNQELYDKYGQIILELIKTRKLCPIVRSSFIKNKYLTLSEKQIEDLLTRRHEPTVLPITDELVKFAQEEEKALGEYLFNELIRFINQPKD